MEDTTTAKTCPFDEDNNSIPSDEEKSEHTLERSEKDFRQTAQIADSTLTQLVMRTSHPLTSPPWGKSIAHYHHRHNHDILTTLLEESKTNQIPADSHNNTATATDDSGEEFWTGVNLFPETQLHHWAPDSLLWLAGGGGPPLCCWSMPAQQPAGVTPCAQDSTRATVERIGPPYLRIYRVALPEKLVNLLDPLIQRAETYASSLVHGWTTNLFSLTRNDLALNDIPGASLLSQPLVSFVCQTILTLYGAVRVEMDQNQPHLLKYSASEGYKGVPLHHDRCAITANLMMSSQEDYQGGGTVFAAFNTTIHLEKGEFLLHPGNLIHGGRDIEAGNRYLMVFFCDLAS